MLASSSTSRARFLERMEKLGAIHKENGKEKIIKSVPTGIDRPKRSRGRPRKVTLLPTQIKAGKKSLQIFKDYSGSLCVARPSAGKTYLSMWLTQNFIHDDAKLKGIFSVAPKTSHESVWQKACLNNSVLLFEILSYQILRGTKSSKSLSHPYLERDGDTFLPTSKLDKIIRQGYLFVFDEIHHGCGDSSQFEAVFAIIKRIRELVKSENVASRFLLLSGSPSTADKQLLNYMRFFGFFDSPFLTEAKGGESVPTGILQVIKKAKSINPKLTASILEDSSYDSSKAALKLARRLYVEILKYQITTTMKPPELEYPHDIANGFYQITSEKRRNAIEDSTTKLRSVLKLKETEQDGKKQMVIGVGKSTSVLAVIANEFQEINMQMVPDLARVILDTLKSNRRSRIAVLFEYREPLEELLRYIPEKYHPKRLDGTTSTKPGVREKIINDFRFGKCRVLVGNLGVMGESINLHNVDGQSDVMMFLSFTLEIKKMYQASWRIARPGLATPAVTRVFYPDKPNDLSVIVDCIARSSLAMKDMLLDEDDQVLLPGEYRSVYED